MDGTRAPPYQPPPPIAEHLARSQEARGSVWEGEKERRQKGEQQRHVRTHTSGEQAGDGGKVSTHR